MDAAAAKSSAKNQKALSGGERSFATVCFIMSLWDAIEAPFRVLDEFDVFMVRMCGSVFCTHVKDTPHTHTHTHTINLYVRMCVHIQTHKHAQVHPNYCDLCSPRSVLCRTW